MRINGNIAEALAAAKQWFSGSFDVMLRELKMEDGRNALVIAIDGMTGSDYIDQTIIRPLMGMTSRCAVMPLATIKQIKEHLVTGMDISEKSTLEEAFLPCLYGDTAIFIEGQTTALVVQTRGFPKRSVSPPDTDRTVRGPKESFTESILQNAALLRRKLKTERLVFEKVRLGTYSGTDVSLAYLSGVADPSLIEKLKERLNRIDVLAVLESGNIEQLIEDHKRSIYPTVGNTEKPDVAAARLVKGRVAILVDGTPFVLTVPMVFSENFRSAEDNTTRRYYASFVRLLRLAAGLVAVLLPALYVALVTYHQEMIPDKLLSMLIRASEGSVFSVAQEMYLMLLLYEILREALLRMPEQLGATVGIVGSLVLGDAAVSAGIVGAPTVAVMALTFICTAVLGAAVESTAIVRLLLLVCASLFGVYGILLGSFLLLAHLSSLDSFGTPYLLPISPFRKKGAADTLGRGKIKDVLKKDGV